MIKSYFDNSSCPYQINYIYENSPLGTAGGLRLLKNIESQRFFVLNCDTIINADYNELYNFHKKGKYAITLIACARNFVIPYGIVELKSEGALSKITEKPEYHFMASVGMYIFEKNILELIPEGKAFDMNNLISQARKKGKCVGVYPVSEKAWIDVGQWEEYHNILNQITK